MEEEPATPTLPIQPHADAIRQTVLRNKVTVICG